MVDIPLTEFRWRGQRLKDKDKNKRKFAVCMQQIPFYIGGGVVGFARHEIGQWSFYLNRLKGV